MVIDNSQLAALEAKIDKLITKCDQLADENKALREAQTNLMAEFH